MALIKEKRRLRRQYSLTEDPAVKTRINQLQKKVKEDLRVETQASWEKFCNSISLESNPSESWRKSGTSSSPRVCTTIQNCTTTTNTDKAQLFAELAERHFDIESKHFDSNHFNEVNKFIEDNHRYFYPPEDPDDYTFDVGNEHQLAEDVNLQSLINLVKFLERGKAPGPDTIHNTMRFLGYAPPPNCFII